MDQENDAINLPEKTSFSYKPIVYLAIISFVSGVFSAVCNSLPFLVTAQGSVPLPGVFFGFVICLFFLKFRKENINVGKIFGFITVSSIAYFTAYYLTFFSPSILSPNGTYYSSGGGFSGDNVFYPQIFILGGLVGAFILMLGVKFLLFPLRWSRILILSILGGILGFVGVAVNTSDQSFFVLFIIWQIGIAIVLGLIMQIDEKDIKPDNFVLNQSVGNLEPKSNIAGIFLAGLLVIFLVYLGYSALHYNQTISKALKEDDVKRPNIVVDSNVSSQPVSAGSVKDIFWTAPSIVNRVDISINSYPHEGKTLQIAFNLSSAGSQNNVYTWNIPQNILVGQYVITISDAGSSGLVGVSRPFGVYNGSISPTEQTYSGTMIFTNQSNPDKVDFAFQFPSLWVEKSIGQPLRVPGSCGNILSDASYCLSFSKEYSGDDLVKVYIFNLTQSIQDWCKSHSRLIDNCNLTTISGYPAIIAMTPKESNPKTLYNVVEGNRGIIVFATEMDKIPEFYLMSSSIRFFK